MSSGDRVAEALEVRESARELYSTVEVQVAIVRLASEVTEKLEGANPVVLAIMQGGVFTAVQLSRRLEFPHEFDYVHATRYGKRLEGGALEWQVQPDTNLKGRVVLVVDDILDEGITIAALHQELRRIGAAAIYTAVLVRKELREPSFKRPSVNFVGFNVEDVYVFGCGMDYKGYWRGLSALYAVR